MGKYLKIFIKFNNACWDPLLNNKIVSCISKISGIPEAMLAVVAASLLAAAVLTVVRGTARGKGLPILPYFGLAEMGFLFSVNGMVLQIPVIHSRLKRALDTYVDVFRRYPDYTEEYIQYTGDTKLEYGSIARYVYNLNGDTRPDDFLYGHIYSTIQSIRGYVDMRGGMVVWMLTAGILLACFTAALISRKPAHLLLCLARGGVLAWCARACVGIFMACIILWGFGFAFSRLFSAESKKNAKLLEQDY